MDLVTPNTLSNLAQKKWTTDCSGFTPLTLKQPEMYVDMLRNSDLHQEDEKIVKIGEPMLLECITHKVYFHIGDSGAYNTGTSHVFSSYSLIGNKNAQTDVGCIDKVKMKDALSAMSVPPSMLLDYARVLEIRRVLEEYTVREERGLLTGLDPNQKGFETRGYEETQKSRI